VERTARPDPPTGLRRFLFRAPLGLYRAHLGVLLGGRFVLINHLGRKTGRHRQVVVEVVSRDVATGAITVASGFGPKADWYRNLRAHPDVTVQVGARAHHVRATFLDGAEAGDAMVDYARRHPRAARGLAGFMGFGVDGSESDYRAAAAEIPMVRLDPVPASANE
jgi:deazaflavin-dependent oxidoreductase (nitroreductase family)